MVFAEWLVIGVGGKVSSPNAPARVGGSKSEEVSKHWGENLTVEMPAAMYDCGGQKTNKWVLGKAGVTWIFWQPLKDNV